MRRGHTRVHHYRGSDGRRKAWSETNLDALAVAAGAQTEQNLLTDLDTNMGVFVNKGWTLIRMVGGVYATPDVPATNSMFGWGICAMDPNVPAINRDVIAATSIRWLGKGFMSNHTTVAGVTYVPVREKFDFRSKYKFPDTREDLWFMTSAQAGAWHFSFNIRCLFLMP